MSDLPLVAVLTTLYLRDSVPLAEKALESLLGQNYPSDRIHIYFYLDGPVTEEQEAFLKRYEGRIYKVIRGSVNRGLAHGLNVLLSSLGDEKYALRMDMDDISLPNRFSEQVAFMEANPSIDLCGCNSDEIDDTGSVVYNRIYPEEHEEIVTKLARCNPVLHPTYCIRTSTLKAKPMKYRDLFLNEDLGFIFDSVCAGWKLHNLQKPLFQWRTGVRFFRRRTLKRSWIEMNIYLKGCWRLWGLTPKMVWPLIRFVVRIIPSSVAKYTYQSSWRNRLLGKQEK